MGSATGTANNRTIICGNGIAVYGTAEGKVTVSTDGGLTWNPAIDPGFGTSASDIFKGAYSPELQKFLLFNDGGKWFMSSDGVNWTQTGAATNANAVDWDPIAGNFLIRNNSSLIYTLSADGSTLTNEGTYALSGAANLIAGIAAGGPNKVVLAASSTTNSGNPRGYYSASPTTTLTIAGAQSDGFKVDDIIDNCGGSDDASIIDLDDTQVTVGGTPSGFNVGDNICRDGSSYTQVINAVDDTSNLTTLPTSAQLSIDKEYYARVKYKDNGSVESEFSEWSEFDTVTIDPVDWGLNTKGCVGQDLAYGNGYYVSSTEGDKIYWATHPGDEWKMVPAPKQSKGVGWYSICYGNDYFVAIGNSSAPKRIMYAYKDPTETSNWVLADGKYEKLNDMGIVYGDGMFVGVSPGKVFYASDPTQVWQQDTFSSFQIKDIAYGQPSAGSLSGQNVYVLVGNNGGVAYSTSHTGPWTASTIPGNTNEWKSVAYGNGYFVTVARGGSGPRLAYTNDPTGPWTLVPVKANVYSSITYGDGYFVAVTSQGSPQIIYAKDPTGTWNSVDSPLYSDWRGVGYGDGYFVAVKDGSDGVKTTMYCKI